MKKLLFLVFPVWFSGICKAQFVPDYGANFFDQIETWSTYIDSLDRSNPPAQSPYQLGSGYTGFGRWISQWDDYMPSSGDFAQAFQRRKELFFQQHMDHLLKVYNQGNIPSQALLASPVLWEEVGPRNLDDVLTKVGSNWVQAHGPGNNIYSGAHTARVDRIFRHPLNPNVLFACTGSTDAGGGGLFRSIDFGTTWAVLGTDIIPNPSVIAFAIKPSGQLPEPGKEFMFIGLASGAVYRSEDDGQTWLECSYHGTVNYPPNNSGSFPSLSLPYSFDYINFNPGAETMGKIMFAPDGNGASEFARIIVARDGGIFYSDNYTSSLTVISPTQLSNAIEWQSFNLNDVLMNEIPIIDPSQNLREIYASDIEIFNFGGDDYYVANIQVTEKNGTAVLSLKNYIISSDDFGLTWHLLGGIGAGSPNALNTTYVNPGNPSYKKVANNIETMRVNPHFIYFACLNPATTSTVTDGYGLYRYDLANQTWSDLSVNSGFSNNFMATQGNGFGIDPNNDYDYWFFTNSYRHFIYDDIAQVDNLVKNVPGHYSSQFHADARDVLVIDANTLFIATDGGIYKKTDATTSIDPSSNGLSAGNSDRVAVTQQAPYYIGSGFWHCGMQIYNPEENIWHWQGLGDGKQGKSLFLNNNIFSAMRGNGTASSPIYVSVYKNFNSFSTVVSGGAIIGIDSSRLIDFDGSENVQGLAFGVYYDSPGLTSDKIMRTTNDFENGSNQAMTSLGTFELFGTRVFVIPNQPEKLVVKHTDSNGKEYLNFYDNINSSPTLYKQVDLDVIYQSFNPGSSDVARFGDIVFDPTQTGKYWMICGSPVVWENGGFLASQGRVVEYDPITDSFNDITFNTDDTRPIYQNVFPPYLSLTSLQMDRQTGLLYLATSNGVYILDRDANIWRKFSANVPYYNGDIDIVHCLGEIYCSTSHRGIWKTKLIRDNVPATEWHITANTTWDYRINLFNTLVVDAGNTLTVKNDLMVYGDQKIIVKPGGKLVIDGGRITAECGEMWAGILLEGNSNAAQTNANQGVLEIINGGTIEHARNAISVYGRDANGNIDWNTTGGIVRASGANFYNNWRVAEFLSYERTGPTGNPLNNVSYFRNCTFQTTGVLRDGTSPLAFITMLDVRNVNIAGNTFRSDLTASDPIIKRGSGIVSIDASYNVTGYCTAPIQFGQPCPTADLIPNRFINLDAGIVTYHGTDVADIGVKDAEFTGCSYGVKVEGADFVEVVRSTFNIPSGSSQFPYSFSNFGVYSRTGDGLKVEQNTFQSSGVHGSGDGRNVGVGAYDHHQTSANVYRNTFTGLETQTQSALDNSKLQVDCNQFTNNSQTIASLHHASGSLANQGECLPDPKFPQANVFSGACDGVNVWQVYRNPGAGVFEYNSYDQSTTGWDLTGCTESNIAAVSQNCGPGNISNACPSTINQGIPVLLDLYNGFVTRIADNGQLMDGGDTQGVLNYLAGTGNPGQIKNYLLARSPYLSDKVLLAAIAKNLPPGIIKQILLANSTLSPQVWQAVENAGYPHGIFNELQAAQTGEGARIDLEKENRYLNVEKLLVLNDIVRIKLDSNEVDSAIYYLEADGSVEASCLLVPVAGKRKPVKAQQHVDRLRDVATDPDVIAKDPDLAADLDKFCSFNEFIIPIAGRAGSYYSMTSQEWNTLQAYAASNSTIATYAESIKRWVGQTVVFDEAWPYLFDRMAVMPQEEELIIKSYGAELLISPNPGNGQYTIQGSILEPFSHGILYISDLTGRTLHSETISGSEFSRQIDISNYENGIYLCVLRLDGQIVASSYIVKQ